MNNQEALDFMKSYSSIREATEVFLLAYKFPDGQSHYIRRKFSQLKSDRNCYARRNELTTWEGLLFHSVSISSPQKKRLCETGTVFQCELPQERRKSLSELTNKGLKNRLSSILGFVSCIAQNENVEPIAIATYVLKLYGGKARNYELVNSCQQLIESGTFDCIVRRLPLYKSLFMLYFLEIGKRKYTRMRRLCKPEDIIFHPYNKISDYRASIIHPSGILEIPNFQEI